MPEQRTLDLNDLDGVMPEVERLLAGHETVGAWSLAQILHHFVVAVRLSMARKRKVDESIEGRDPFRGRRKLFFRTGRFPNGVVAPMAILIPPDDCDLAERVQALRDVIDRFQNDDGPFASHPFLGALDKAEWSRFHAMHCAHHLGFALPYVTVPINGVEP